MRWCHLHCNYTHQLQPCPRPFLHQSQTIPAPFPEHPCTIPRPFPDHSCTIPRPFLHHSQTIPAPFPDHSCTIPRPFQPQGQTKVIDGLLVPTSSTRVWAVMANCGIVMSQVNKRFLFHYILATPFVLFQSLKLQKIRATKHMGSSFTTCVFSLRNDVKMTSYSWAVECLSIGSFAAERTWCVLVTIYQCLQMLKLRINLAIFASITSNFLASFPGRFSYGLGTRLATWSSIKYFLVRYYEITFKTVTGTILLHLECTLACWGLRDWTRYPRKCSRPQRFSTQTWIVCCTNYKKSTASLSQVYLL